MSNVAWIVLWLSTVCAGIAAMQWGAQRVCGLLGGLRLYWGLPATAGGALMGLATASPEISVNVVAVAFGWPDIGLGTALGSNVPALPLIILISFVSTRWHRRDAIRAAAGHAGGAGPRRRDIPVPRPVPHVAQSAVPVQVVPYLLVVIFLGLLTLPPRWRGLHPPDAVLLVLAALAYYAQALLRNRRGGDRREGVSFPRREALRAVPGVLAIAAGAVGAVLASRRLDDLLGISDLVGGLFITGLLCALPESFAAWHLSRAGQATTAISGATADGIVSLTLALVPLAIIGAPIGGFGLYVVNLAFLAVILVVYIALSRRETAGETLTLRKVAVFGSAYLAYVAGLIWTAR